MSVAPGTATTRVDQTQRQAYTTSRADLEKRWLLEVVRRTDMALEAFLTAPPGAVPEQLAEAMRYACLNGGKRLRPALVYAAAQAATSVNRFPDTPGVERAAIAVEMIHAFSLVHDDLPCMDDDDVRRGMPALHKAFYDAIAILGGSWLLVLAFEVLSDGSLPAKPAMRMIREISHYVGCQGLAGGQILDLNTDGRAASLDTVERIARLKTASLTEVSCRCGAIAAGAGNAMIDRLGMFGRYLGYAFQAMDDLLDATARESEVGKRLRKDCSKGRPTAMASGSVAEVRKRIDLQARRAADLLCDMGPEADPLRAILKKCVDRNR
jgi:farnesyl diphosphate synthase